MKSDMLRPENGNNKEKKRRNKFVGAKRKRKCSRKMKGCKIYSPLDEQKKVSRRKTQI